MSNKVTVSFGDVEIGKTDYKTDLASVVAKYTLKRGGKVVEKTTFSAKFSGRSLRRLRAEEAKGGFKDIECSATRRVVESFIIYSAIIGAFKKGDTVTIRTKRDVVPVASEVVNVVGQAVGCTFIIES